MSRKNRNRSTNFEQWSPSKNIEGKPNTETAPKKNQFATRERANDFLRLMQTLPDPDPVLKKMGRGITALQELLTDSHLESVWSVRCSTISGAEWFMAQGAETGKEKEAAETFSAMLKKLDLPRIIEEMMNAVAFGFSPLEILWTNNEGRWDIADIVGKPPEWFEYNQENHLVFRTGAVSTEELPKKSYIEREYEIPEEDFDMLETAPNP